MKEEEQKVPQKARFGKIGKSDSSDEDDENFEEPEDQRAIPTFLINLPGVTATDSRGYRIEALRVYLEN